MKFSDYSDWIRRGDAGVAFTRTGDQCFSLRPAPRLLFGTPPDKFAEWYYGDRGAQEAGVLTLEGFTVLGNHLWFRDGHGMNILQCGIYFGDEHPDPAAQIVARHLTARRFAGEWVVLTGLALGMYGHWMVDFLPRLFNLVSSGHDVTQLRLLLPAGLPKANLLWLAMLGIAAENIATFDERTEYCQIEHALVPLGLRGNARAHPMFQDAAHWMRSHALADHPIQTSGRKLFITRSAWGNASRVLENESELAACAVSQGFEEIAPEKFSVQEQVRLFAEASIIAGDYGSALHNSIFAPAGSMVLAFRGRFGHPGFLQSGLCEAMKQDCAYLFGVTSGTEDQQIYHVPLDDFRLCLDLVQNLSR